MATATHTLGNLSVFGDDVYTSTDLNRRSSEVLNHARVRPVTISRNDELFALLRRDQAANLVQSVRALGTVVGLLSEVKKTFAGELPSSTFSWLKTYDKEDLETLFKEVLQITVSALAEEVEFSEVEALIHEWHESALVAQSGVLRDATSEEAYEVPMLHPHDVISSDEATSLLACAK